MREIEMISSKLLNEMTKYTCVNNNNNNKNYYYYYYDKTINMHAYNKLCNERITGTLLIVL